MGQVVPEKTIQNGISTPEGFIREDLKGNAFAEWLRNLPLRENETKVYLYDGREKPNQRAHHSVVQIDIGARNLQQCADAIIRLRAEFLFATTDPQTIAFNFTNGDTCRFSDWSKGLRPKITGSKVEWVQTGKKGSSYALFRNYLNMVFAYAGTYSLSKEMQEVDMKDLQVGHVFIQGGFPGHAMLVVDSAISKETGQRIFLLAQSFMPAQDIHIVRNPHDGDLSPWFALKTDVPIVTPEWVFQPSDLKAFVD